MLLFFDFLSHHLSIYDGRLSLEHVVYNLRDCVLFLLLLLLLSHLSVLLAISLCFPHQLADQLGGNLKVFGNVSLEDMIV